MIFVSLSFAGSDFEFIDWRGGLESCPTSLSTSRFLNLHKSVAVCTHGEKSGRFQGFSKRLQSFF